MSTTEAVTRSGSPEAADLRFGQVGMASVRARTSDPDTLRASLAIRVHEAPALFARAPVVLDLSFLPSPPSAAIAHTLLDAVRAAGMLPVGLAYGDAATGALAEQLGLPSIAKFRAAQQHPARPRPAPAHEANPPAIQTAPAPGSTTVQHLQSVRSGQQVYAQGADLVVVGAVANGAEVLADGNVHIYGALRGRAFAGALGDTTARIYCSEFRAEIVSIAGHYRVFEELPPEFAGRAVQINLNDGKLQIARL